MSPAKDQSSAKPGTRYKSRRPHPGRRGHGLTPDLPPEAGLAALGYPHLRSLEFTLLSGCLLLMFRGEGITYAKLQAISGCSPHTVQRFLVTWDWWLKHVLAHRVELARSKCMIVKENSSE